MSYESISLVEMDDFLRQRRFKPVDLYFRRRPVKEWVYERRLPQNANHFVRVYTTIQRYGGKADQSRDVGKDAIRVQVIYRDEKGETLVSMPKRVNRVSTWRDNLDDRLKEVAESLPKVKMDSRGEPMTLRKKRGNLFWGSRDYPKYKETQRYGAEDNTIGGVAVLYPEDSQVSGVVRFQPVTDGLLISYQIKGLTDGKHGFHIHEYGDLTDGCTSACAHFNPDGATHGGLETKVRHFGDLGNIVSNNGLSKGYLFLKNGCLDGSKYSILGRMIIVHADPDDLGKGGDEESLKTGNAGKRLACGVIGLADPKEAVDKKAEEVEMLLHPYHTPDSQINLLEKFPNAKNFGALLNQQSMPEGFEEVIVLNSMEELLEQKTSPYHGIYYINFPLTVYRGVNIHGDSKEWTWQRWLEGDKLGTSTNMGVIDSQPTTLNIQEALEYAGANYSWSVKNDYAPQDFELYAIQIQDYFVMFPRLSQRSEHRNCNPVYEEENYVNPHYGKHTYKRFISCDNPQHQVETPVIFILGGARYEDLEVIWDSDANYFSFDAEDKRECCKCQTQEGLATVQEGTYCYDCLPINLGAEDNYDATYGKKQAKIRRRLKNKIMKQNIMGTAANKWSARKSQELKRQYEKACEKAGLASYKGSKTAKQDDLSNWSKQKWTTASGKKSSVTGEPYFPEKAVAALKKRGLYAKAKRQKQKANKAKKNARYSDDIREVVGQFRAEDINQTRNNTIINLLLVEWIMRTNQIYDSLTITKGLADYIDNSPYDFVRHMQNQDLISLMPSSRALVPADFLYYLKDKDRDHWANMKSRAISKERYQMVKEQISEDVFWLSDHHKVKYYQWLPKSAINYQNI